MAAKCASKTLFVGNLHASLEETDLLEIFRPFGRIVECCKRWCHYGFIQFATEDEAKLAFNNLNGSRVRGRPMRIEFQRKKIRNLAALLEAEAQAKSKTSNAATNERESPSFLDDSENVSPAASLTFAQLFNQKTQNTSDQAKQQFSLHNTNSNDNLFKIKPAINSDENVKYSAFENDLLKQLSFLDSDSSSNNSSTAKTTSSSTSSLFSRKLINSTNVLAATTNTLPLGTRNLNVSSSSSSSKNNLIDGLNENSCTFAKEIATNVLTKTSTQKKPISKPIKDDEIDAKSTAWINYLLDKASKYSSKNNKASTFSLSSSPLSPTNQRDHSPNHLIKSHTTSNSIETSLSSNSIILYRSLNSSNTIFVQPTDILEPLEVGDFNEYKLFPTTAPQALTMSSPNKIDNDYTKEIEIIVELTPPSSVSLSSASSTSSSSRSSSTSSTSSSSFRRSLNYRKSKF